MKKAILSGCAVVGFLAVIVACTSGKHNSEIQRPDEVMKGTKFYSVPSPDPDLHCVIGINIDFQRMPMACDYVPQPRKSEIKP